MADVELWQVDSFGRDCLGNVTGYRVYRYVWRECPHSDRTDGLVLKLEVAESFVGNIYREGSHTEAYANAVALRDRLNEALLAEKTGIEDIARQHLGIETLETRKSDALDFHSVSVWGVKSALMAAYEAGRRAAAPAV